MRKVDTELIALKFLVHQRLLSSTYFVTGMQIKNISGLKATLFLENYLDGRKRKQIVSTLGVECLVKIGWCFSILGSNLFLLNINNLTQVEIGESLFPDDTAIFDERAIPPNSNVP